MLVLKFLIDGLSPMDQAMPTLPLPEEVEGGVYVARAFALLEVEEDLGVPFLCESFGLETGFGVAVGLGLGLQRLTWVPMARLA